MDNMNGILLLYYDILFHSEAVRYSGNKILYFQLLQKHTSCSFLAFTVGHIFVFMIKGVSFKKKKTDFLSIWEVFYNSE